MLFFVSWMCEWVCCLSWQQLYQLWGNDCRCCKCKCKFKWILIGVNVAGFSFSSEITAVYIVWTQEHGGSKTCNGLDVVSFWNCLLLELFSLSFHCVLFTSCFISKLVLPPFSFMTFASSVSFTPVLCLVGYPSFSSPAIHTWLLSVITHSLFKYTPQFLLFSVR